MAKGPGQIELGFSMAYKHLLEAIAEGDKDMIDQMCEKTLSNKFISGLDSLAHTGNGLRIVALNIAAIERL